MAKKLSVFCVLFLAITLLVCSIPARVHAADVVRSGTCGNGVSWSLDTEGILTISGKGSMTQFSLDTQVPWHNYRLSIKKVVIGNGVTNVAAYSFINCSNLSQVSMPTSVTSIGQSAFQSCTSLTAMNLGGNVNSIGMSAFYDCTGLNSITIPKTVTTIGYGAFFNCIALERVYIADFASWCGITFAGYNSNPLYYADTLYVNGKVTTDVVIPSGVKKIPAYAFYGWTTVESVQIANSVTEIAAYAFSGCTGLTEITIPASVTSIGGNAFLSCGLKNASYGGTQEQWNAMNVGSGNGILIDLMKSKVRFNISGANLKLGDSLTMFFYVKYEDLEGTDYYAEISKTYADSRGTVVETIPYSQWEEYNASMLRMGYDGIAAKEMADTITVVIYNGKGEAVSNAWNDSIRSYVDRVIDNQANKGKTMMADMLNYGAAAQTYFNYNTADPANSVLTGARQAYATATVTATDNRVMGDNYKGSALSLNNEILLTMYFENINRDMTARITYVDHNGKARERTVSGSKFITKGALLGVDVTGLAVADGKQLIKCEILDSNGKVVASAQDSVESYIARMLDSSSLFGATMKFVAAAYNYFH